MSFFHSQGADYTMESKQIMPNNVKVALSEIQAICYIYSACIYTHTEKTSGF